MSTQFTQTESQQTHRGYVHIDCKSGQKTSFIRVYGCYPFYFYSFDIFHEKDGATKSKRARARAWYREKMKRKKLEPTGLHLPDAHSDSLARELGSAVRLGLDFNEGKTLKSYEIL